MKRKIINIFNTICEFLLVWFAYYGMSNLIIRDLFKLKILLIPTIFGSIVLLVVFLILKHKIRKEKIKEIERLFEFSKIINKTNKAVNIEVHNYSKNDEIKDVIFNNPATIIKWNDGSKTIVKCAKDETYNKSTGLAMCMLKKMLGNKYKKIFKYWVGEE